MGFFGSKILIMEKKRILFIINSFKVGGAEKALYNLIKWINKDKFDVLVVTLVKQNSPFFNFDKIDSIELSSVNLKMDFLFLRELYRLYRLVKEFNPDIVQTWLYHTDLIGGVIAKFCGVKKIYWGVRSSELVGGNSKLSLRIVRWLCGMFSYFVPTKVICNSNSGIRSHLRLGYSRKKMALVHNGFDTSQFYPDLVARENYRSKLGIDKNVKIIGMVARFDPLKNQLGFVDVIEKLAKKYSNFVVIMIGTNVNYDNEVLTKKIKLADLDRFFLLLGERNDVAALMCSFDFLVCPSLAEAFPNVIGEAMACEVPCIAYDVGDCGEIIGDTGIVCSKNEESKLVLAVSDFLALSDQELLGLGKAARKRVIERFTLATSVTRFEDTYSDI